MRSTAYAALSSDAGIVALVGVSGVYSTYEEVPPVPFLVIRFGSSRGRGVSDAYSEFFQVWAHDKPGSYKKIDQMLRRAQEVLEALPNQGKLFEVSWLEDSSDLPLDASTGTIARFSRYQHTSRR